MSDSFQLDPILEKDSVLIKELKLCQLRLLKDGELDWFLLIPMINDIKEVFQLSQKEQYQLSDEVNQVSVLLKEFSSFDKLNIASIGNMVPQLHVHIIARNKSDRAWPAPIWGTSSKEVFKVEKVEYWKSKTLDA